MREFALASMIKNKEIIEDLQRELRENLNSSTAIITNYSDNNFSYILFACDEKYLHESENIIKETIINYVETKYKVLYLKDKIETLSNKIFNRFKMGSNTNKLAFDAYIKLLSVFDRVTDKSALEKIIILNQIFFVDSFLSFRLMPLKKHWDNLAELTSENMIFFNSNTFVDVIKFLLNSMDVSAYKVKLIEDKGKFSVYIMENKNSQIKKLLDQISGEEMVATVISSCPNFVDVYLASEDSFEAISFLSSVFCSRLKIFVKN